MTWHMDTRAEIVKLAQLLEADPRELAHLEPVGWVALRAVRQDMTDQLFAAYEKRLHNLALASKLVPVAVIAKLAPMFFTPRLSAATAGLVDADRAVKLAGKLPVAYLADAAVYIDPRKVGPIASQIPTEVAVPLAKLMVERGEFITIGKFVDFLTPELLEAVLPVVDDPSLLRTAFTAENKKVFDQFIPLLPKERLVSIMRAAHEHDLWDEALDLINEVNDENRVMLANLAAELDDQFLTSLVRAAYEHRLLDLLLPVTAGMDAAHVHRLAQLPAVQDPDLLAAVAEAADRHGLWSALLPVAKYLPEPVVRRLGQLALFREDAVLDRMIGATVQAHAFADLLPIVSLLPEDVQQAFARIAALYGDALEHVVAAALETDTMPTIVRLFPHALPGLEDEVMLRTAELLSGTPYLDPLAAQIPDDRMARVMHTAAVKKLWPQALHLLNDVGEERRVRLANLAAHQPPRVLNALIEAVYDHRMFDQLLPITTRMSPDSLRLFADLPSVQHPVVMRAITEAAFRADLWAGLLPLVPHLPEPALEAAAGMPMFEDEALLRRLVNTALGRRDQLAEQVVPLFADLMPLVPLVPASVQRKIAALLGDADPEMLRWGVRTTVSAGVWQHLVTLVPLLPVPAQQLVLREAGAVSDELSP